MRAYVGRKRVERRIGHAVGKREEVVEAAACLRNVAADDDDVLKERQHLAR